jgi:hypothetical protein
VVPARGASLAEDLAGEIRRILDRGPDPPEHDEWPLLEAEATSLADAVARSWGSGPHTTAPELDVVCSGGGWRNIYCGGAYAVLRSLEDRGALRLRRAAGASSGALAAGCIGCRCPARDWYRLHDAWWVLHARYGLRVYNAVIRGFVRAFYPADAHVRCSCSADDAAGGGAGGGEGGGAMFSISDCSGLPWQRPTRLLAADFLSFADFEGAIIASSALPFVIGQPFFLPWRGRRCLDGGLVDNCPTFTDGKRPQLVVNLASLDSPAAEMHLLPDRCGGRCVIFGGRFD